MAASSIRVVEGMQDHKPIPKDSTKLRIIVFVFGDPSQMNASKLWVFESFDYQFKIAAPKSRGPTLPRAERWSQKSKLKNDINLEITRSLLIAVELRNKEIVHSFIQSLVFRPKSTCGRTWNYKLIFKSFPVAKTRLVANPSLIIVLSLYVFLNFSWFVMLYAKCKGVNAGKSSRRPHVTFSETGTHFSEDCRCSWATGVD